jgi:hypothetical protein
VVRVFTPSRPVGVGRKRPRPDSSRPEPDYNLAYALATASYCAYGVGQKDADQSHDRAVKCLRLAAKAGSRLNGLDVGPNNVEAYVNPVQPVDAYLLINAKDSFKTFFSGQGHGGAGSVGERDILPPFRRHAFRGFFVRSEARMRQRQDRVGGIFSRPAFMNTRRRSCPAIRNGATC